MDRIGKIARRTAWLGLAFLGLTGWLRGSTLVESAAASDLTGYPGSCSNATALGSLPPQALVSSGATTGSYATTIAKGSTEELVLNSASGVPGLTSWPAGNWVVQLDVTTANTNLSWTATCVVRVSSTGSNLGEVGSLTGQNISLGATGVQSMTISGALMGTSSTDRVQVIVEITNSAAHQNESVTFDAGNATNDIVTMPGANAYSVSLSEALSQSDAIARVAGFGRGVTDTPTTSDSVAQSEGFPVTLAENESISDSLGQQFGVAVTLAETEPVSDSLGRLAAYSRAPGETLSQSDTVSRLGAFGRTLAEAETVSDAPTRSAGYIATASESESVSDAVGRSFGAVVALGESQALADALARQTAITRAPSETLAQSDSLARLAAFGRAATEAETLMDAVTSFYRSGARVAPLHGATLGAQSGGAAISPRRQGATLGAKTQGAAVSGHGAGTVLQKPQ